MQSKESLAVNVCPCKQPALLQSGLHCLLGLACFQVYILNNPGSGFYAPSLFLQMMTIHCLQAEVPSPLMSPEAAKLLDKMGLSFSASNQLWTRLVRYWKQFLVCRQHAADQDAELAETAVSKVFGL